jgi:membrane associated rhomboid family serine protease
MRNAGAPMAVSATWTEVGRPDIARSLPHRRTNPPPYHPARGGIRLIPIGTDIRTRRLPAANVAIIIANIAVFILTDGIGGSLGQSLKHDYMLDAARPMLHQYLTYQFLHGDIMHLAGNMLFLWVFGNAVCDKLGNTCYTLFYLAGGVFSGFFFAMSSSTPIIGASGAIAAVTTAFLALFPRSRVHMLLLWFIITTFELPSTILIVFKIILWDNVIAPRLAQGVVHNVAYSAHLGGYTFGFLAALLLLATRALPRSHFDILALFDRYRRRTGFTLDSAGAVRQARPVSVYVENAARQPAPAVVQLRHRIDERLVERDVSEAARLYLELTELTDRPLLARQAQLDVANQLAAMQIHEQAARAYELFLSAYPGSGDANQVRLLLGLIYSRHLNRYDRAVEHLRRAADTLPQESQRQMALDELGRAQAYIYGPGAQPG